MFHLTNIEQLHLFKITNFERCKNNEGIFQSIINQIQLSVIQAALFNKHTKQFHIQYVSGPSEISKELHHIQS
jgi:hypothetical protein